MFKLLIIITTLVCPESIIAFLANSTKVATPNYHLPSISNLPSVNFSSFKKQHPRLPAPNANDIKELKHHNPLFFKQHRNKASIGQLYSRILIAYIYPEEKDLDELYNDLITLTFSERGDKQTKPLALAYDWLYQRWSPEQRLKLKIKLQHACNYQIHIIRDKMQLSPYNVFLYNSPLQALVAAALSLHKDIPEKDDDCMRFTYDYWKKRVLPVWRQIMGENGGWHEGGEYVGIGIGQAIYQIPAMWRHATGEDYFQSEPGIKGFLDFLVYRTRPDNTHFRWGDAAFFNRHSPDRTPLAIEFQHKPAYSLQPETQLRPTSWPWGPLTDKTLMDNTAINQLPLTKLFDGIGLILSRTSWDKNATYVTFKAGNNYWSHSHLDQGAFTIFKGGALAIDSGLYGPEYASDHHMNYTYQSIAHNLVTINDPEDILVLPAKNKDSEPRAIANDGGQRRVGSGWGLKAPLDLSDWNQQKNIYYTARITQFQEQDNVVIAVADLTPAYNNDWTETNAASPRTKRVENYWRVFIHDKNHDLIIILDHIKSTNPLFRKKWLLHSLNEPTIKGRFFHLATPASPVSGMAGGKLSGQVLWPQYHLIQKIGGKGFEFYVDGENYDENGRVINKAEQLKNTEPGRWRIELQPKKANEDDIFLVALQPLLLHESKPFPVIHTIKDKNRIVLTISEQKKFIINLNDKQEQLTVDFLIPQ